MYLLSCTNKTQKDGKCFDSYKVISLIFWVNIIGDTYEHGSPETNTHY
jgi:hypothetical protein